MLRVTDIQKAFRSPETGGTVTVVDVPAFALAAGDQVALIGSSGSGKTTFLHLLAGILGADGGAIEFTIERKKTDLVKLSEAARDHFRGQHIGYIFQTHHLLPGLTAMENVLLGMAFTGRHAEPAWPKHLLERVGLQERLGYKPGKMSVGQQQRVAIARALANKPQLVLADEPTGSLDRANARQALGLIRELCREVNAALVLVTHDLEIAGEFPRQQELAALQRGAAVGAAR